MTEKAKTANSTSFKPGFSGNPNGRPRKDQADSIEDLKKSEKLLRKAIPEAVKILIKTMQEATSPEAKQKAATVVIDKFVVVSKELDRKEDREAGTKTPISQDDDDKPKVTRVSFTLNQPKDAESA